MQEKEKLIELCKMAANEHDLQKLRRLIQQISVLLEAKEQRPENKIPDTHQERPL